MSCVVFDNSTDNAADTTGWFRDSNNPVRVSDNMINNTHDGDLVTSVLTIENVSLNDNGNGYFCVPSLRIASNVGIISVADEIVYIRICINVCTQLTTSIYMATWYDIMVT